MTEELNIPEDFEDLQKHAPRLARIRKENPFSVPDGYFENLDAVSRIIPFKKGNGGFTVPENYFDELPDIIQNRIFLSGLKQDTGVPEGYFDTLAGKIQGEIFISGLPKENPFTVPEDYFETLADRIRSRLVLEQLKKENPFAVPDGYFEQLSSAIEKKVGSAEKKEAKIISLFTIKNLSWAAAAAVVLLVGLNLFTNSAVEVSETKIIEVASNQRKSIIENAEMYDISESDVIDALEANGESITDKVDISEEDQQAIDFLMDNNIDVNSIINE